MRTDTFWDIIASFDTDNPDKEIVLSMKGGGELKGIMRAPGSYGHPIPRDTIWFTPEGGYDLVVDIRSIIGLRRYLE